MLEGLTALFLRMVKRALEKHTLGKVEEEIVYSASEICNLVERGSAKRHIAEALLNKQRSRSHSIFSITIHSNDDDKSRTYESLCHCRWVDEIVPDAPWVITKEFLDKHQIDCVAHDALPYADTSGAGNDASEYIKSIGKFKETKRTEGISTSDIITRMLKDYNEYVMRNLARGYTRKDLGVSYVKEKQLRVNMSITKLRQKVKEHEEPVGRKLHIVATRAGIHHSEWVENADRWVAGFLEKFEEGCYLMETAIKTRIQKGLMKEQVKQTNDQLQKC